ncbi:hypothetical protein [Polaribacter butkevichii]|uniref:hypothetical protein n=1 Tax=Polaribacter butkevichii TaxID=218490 RepID=UPI0030FCD9FA
MHKIQVRRERKGMKIKHKETKIERNPTFGEWVREYVRKELYKDWEILNLNNVVKVKTLHKDGKTSETLMSKRDAERHKNQFSTSTSILKEKVTMEFYKEYLETKILKNQNKSSQNHFLKRIRYAIFEKIRPKAILKPIWKSIVVIILSGLGTLLGYILVEFYKTF